MLFYKQRFWIFYFHFYENINIIQKNKNKNILYNENFKIILIIF